MIRHRLSLLLLIGLSATPALLSAQDTRADSAATLLRAARVLEARGELRLARELLRVLAERFPETATAAEGRRFTDQLGEEESLVGFNRGGFIAYHTAFGAWLGVVIPAALDSDASEAYGAGLLIGAPLGFFGSRALAEKRNLSSGQAALLQFGSTWGTWQAVGWQDLLNIGVEEYCELDFCYETSSSTAGWTAALVGGVAGFGAGLLASRINLTQGQASVVTQSAIWGTWYGAAIFALISDTSNDALGGALLGGNLALLAAIPAARGWRPTAAKVRTITAAGLGGGLAGLGVVLLTSTESEDGVIGIIAAGTTIGLIGGAALVRDRLGPVEGAAGSALLNYRSGWTLGTPLPIPAAILTPDGSRRHTVPGVRIPLLHLNW
ncbi:MAG: hypothetical protein SGI84_08540 [Gemmatimonadota bacterium]|nr:hypothetical protein [Gemmatimonadota bacterium]